MDECGGMDKSGMNKSGMNGDGHSERDRKHHGENCETQHDNNPEITQMSPNRSYSLSYLQECATVQFCTSYFIQVMGTNKKSWIHAQVPRTGQGTVLSRY